MPESAPNALDLSHLYPIEEAPNRLPRTNGKKIHRATVFRWAKNGIRGVVLQTQLVGRRRFTCDEWVEMFLERVNRANDAAQSAAAGGGAAPKPAKRGRPRRSRYETAMANLRAKGY